LSLKQYFEGIRTNKLRENLILRRKSVIFTLSIAIPFAFLFSMTNFLYGHEWLALIEAGVGAGLLPAFLIIRQDRWVFVSEIMLMLAAIIIFGSLLIDGGIAGTGVYWSNIYPFVAFYVMGNRQGWFWVGALALLIAAASATSLAGMFEIPYSPGQLAYFGSQFLFFTLIASGYNFLREYHLDESIKANQRLLKATRKRKEAEEGRMRAEAQLLHGEKLKSLGALAGGIAHDFNNQLSVIMGHAEISRMDLPGNTA